MFAAGNVDSHYRFFYASKPISTHYYIYSQPHYIMASARITLFPSSSRDAKSCVSREGMRNQAVLWDEELTAIWLDGRRKILRLYWLARLGE